MQKTWCTRIGLGVGLAVILPSNLIDSAISPEFISTAVGTGLEESVRHWVVSMRLILSIFKIISGDFWSLVGRILRNALQFLTVDEINTMMPLIWIMTIMTLTWAWETWLFLFILLYLVLNFYLECPFKILTIIFSTGTIIYTFLSLGPSIIVECLMVVMVMTRPKSKRVGIFWVEKTDGLFSFRSLQAWSEVFSSHS